MSISGKIGQRRQRERDASTCKLGPRAKQPTGSAYAHACCTSQLPAAGVHEDKMRVAWGRLPFAARRGDSAAALAHSELNIGCFSSAPWVGIIIIVWIDYSRGPFDSKGD